MIQIQTGYPTIFRFDDVLNGEVCDMLVNYMIDKKSQNANINLDLFPWQNGDSLNWKNVKNDFLYSSILNHRNVVNEFIISCYNELVFPHFTDLVLWRIGRSMPLHCDDGHTGNKSIDDHLSQRVFTSVTYLNDNYGGGETFISTKSGDYISIPKKGAVIIFKSSSENSHGVRKITSGIRCTLPIWFTKLFEYRENEDVR